MASDSSLDPTLDDADTSLHALLAALDEHTTAMQYVPTALASKRSSDPDTPTYREAVFGDHGHE